MYKFVMVKLTKDEMTLTALPESDPAGWDAVIVAIDVRNGIIRAKAGPKAYSVDWYAVAACVNRAAAYIHGDV